LSSAFICNNTAKHYCFITLWRHPSTSLQQECVFYIVINQYKKKIKRTVSHILAGICFIRCYGL